MATRVTWCVVILLGALSGCGSAPQNAVRRSLIEALLNGYDSLVPPHESEAGMGEHTHVSASFAYVHGLSEVDLERGFITFPANLLLEWQDARLDYNGTSWFGSHWNTGFVTLPSREQTPGNDFDHVWTPEVWLGWSGQFEWISDSDVEVYEGGWISWYRECEATVRWDFNLYDFPFDVHFIDFWLSLQEKSLGQNVLLSVGKLHGQKLALGAYELQADVSVLAGNVTFDCEYEYDNHCHMVDRLLDENFWYDGIQHTDVGTEIASLYLLRRHSEFYVINVVIPLLFMIVLQAIALWLPLDCGERVSYSATVFLTVIAIILFTVELRPATRQLTWLDKLQGITLLLCFVPLVESSMLLWLNHTMWRVSTIDPDGEGDEVSGSISDAIVQEMRNWRMSVDCFDHSFRHIYPILLVIICISTGDKLFSANVEFGWSTILEVTVSFGSVFILMCASVAYLYVRFIRRVLRAERPAVAGGAHNDMLASQNSHSHMADPETIGNVGDLRSLDDPQRSASSPESEVVISPHVKPLAGDGIRD